MPISYSYLRVSCVRVVCVCEREVTSVAVCVAMVMLAAGQDRTCQGGGEDRQMGAQTHNYITHTPVAMIAGT